MNIQQHLNDQFPTVDALLGATTYARSGSIIIGTKAYMRHEDLSPLYVPGLDPNAQDDISDYLSGLTVDVNVTSDTMRTAKFTIELFPGFEHVNLVRDLVLVTLVWYDEQVRVKNETNLGYFTFVIPDESTSGAVTQWSVDAQDLTERLVRKGFLNTFTLPAGIELTTAMAALVQMDKLPPSQGGRAPSGVPWPGTPTAGQPQYGGSGGVYRATGVRLSSVATVSDNNQNYLTPSSGPYGTMSFTTLADIQVDPTTFAPIDPWSLQPMVQDTRSDGTPLFNWWQASYKNLVYYAPEGLFTYNFADVGFTSQSPWIDPYKLVPVSNSFYVGFVNTTDNADNAGRPLPLQTWPYDFDHSGAYFESAPVTPDPLPPPTAGGTTTSSEAISRLPSMGSNGALLASRFASGTAGVTLLAGGHYAVMDGTTHTDPDYVGHAWSYPPDLALGGTWSSWELPLDGYDLVAGTWGFLAFLAASPTPTGTLTDISFQIMVRHADGTSDVVGTGGAPDVTLPATVSSEVSILADIAVGAVTGAAGDVLLIQMTFQTVGVAAQASSAGPQYSGVLNLIDVNIGLPLGSTVSTTATVASPNPGGALPAPSTMNPVTPVQSATQIPWPDTNNPALTPAGCDTIGPNFPASRVRVTPLDAIIPSPLKLTTKQNFLAQYNGLADIISYNHVWFTTDGDLIVSPSWFSADNAIPVPVLTLSTERDQAIFPSFDSKVMDLTTIANVWMERAEPNGATPLKAIRWNTSPDSYISIPNLGDTIMGSEQNDDIFDQNVLNAIADEKLEWAAMGQQVATFDSFPCPWIEPFDPILLEIIRPDGTVKIAPDPNFPFIVTQFTIDPANRKMSWTVARWIPL